MPSQKALTLAQKLRISRRQMGMSQKEFGAAVQLSDKAISAYEVGRAQPNVDTLRQIGQLTNKPISYFLEENPDDSMQINVRLKVIEKELAAIRKILDPQGE